MYIVYRYRPTVRGQGYWTTAGATETLERADHLASCVYNMRGGKLVKAKTRIENMPEVHDVLDAPATLVV